MGQIKSDNWNPCNKGKDLWTRTRVLSMASSSALKIYVSTQSRCVRCPKSSCCHPTSQQLTVSEHYDLSFLQYHLRHAAREKSTELAINAFIMYDNVTAQSADNMKIMFGTRVGKCYNTIFIQLKTMWQRSGFNTEAASAWKIIFKHRWCFNSSPAGHGTD